MKWPFGNYRFSWFVVFCLVAITAILACNLWLLCWGHCVINDFLQIPTVGWGLIIANLGAGLALFLVKSRNNSKRDGLLCASCGTGLRELWRYCPVCGHEQHQ